MPQGCRLRNAALRGCLIAGICLWAIPTLGQTQEPETKTETPTPEVQQVEPVKPVQLPLPKQEQQQPPAKQKPLCDEAEAGPESNLCQQWRVAEAAEEQVRWTSRLYYLTAWETGALVLTLLATAAAAIAAVVAAKAARAAVQVTSNTAERQLRAYVVAGTDAEWQQAYVGSSDNIVGYNFAMKWKNCGSTPARRCQTRTSLAVFDGVIPSDFDYPDKAALEITKTNHIGPSLDFRSKVGGLSIPDAEAAERGEKHAYVWSWIEYDDIFGRVRHRTEVCYELRISKGGQTCTPTIVGPFNGADEDCYHQPKT